MSEVPLLQKSEQSLSPTSCLGSALGTLRGQVEGWQKAVLSEEYLSSGVSRRRTWRWLWPGFAWYGLFQDLVIPGGQLGAYPDPQTVIGDVILLAVMFGISRISIKTMKPDAIITFFLICGACSYDSTVSTSDYQNNKFGIQMSSLLVVTLGVIGLHSVCLVVLAACYSLIVITDDRTLSDTRVFVVWTTTFFALSFAAIEFFLAKLFGDLQFQLAVSQTLLDRASDGFGAVDPSGIIQSASAGMSTTFGCEDCVGLCLKQLVNTEDDAAKIDSLLAREGDQSLQPVLVTCLRLEGQMPTHIFEALICPYQVSSGCLDIFIRISGEIREYKEVEVPVHDGNSSADEDADGDLDKFDVESGSDAPGRPVKVPRGDDLWELASLTYSVSTKSSRVKVESAEAATQTDFLPSMKPPMPPSTALQPVKPRRTSAAVRSRSSSPLPYHQSLSNSCLKATTTAIRIQSLVRFLRQWNIQLDGTACCPMHAHIQECALVLKKLRRMLPCEHPERFACKMGDEQCDRCGMVNFYSVEDYDDEVRQEGEPPPCSWCSACTWDDIQRLESDAVCAQNKRPLRSKSREPSRENSSSDGESLRGEEDPQPHDLDD